MKIISYCNTFLIQLRLKVKFNWRLILIFLSLFSFATSLARNFSKGNKPILNADSAFFQHAGWYINQGAIPYIQIWDIKPPMTYYTTTALARLSIDNMYNVHIYNVILTIISGILIVLFVGELINQITNDNIASVIGGISVLTFAGFHYLASQGFRPKYLSIAFGLLGIILQYRDRPFQSGLTSALSAGYVQHAAIFAIITLGIAAQNSEKSTIYKTFIGMLIMTLLVILPIYWFNANSQMITQVILVPFAASEPMSMLETIRRVGKLLLYTGYSMVIFIIGAYAIMKTSISNLSENWWVILGLLMYIIILLIADFDNYPDIFFLLIFVSIGVGLYVAHAEKSKKSIVIALVTIIAIFSVISMGGVGLVTNGSVYTQSLDQSLNSSDTLIHNGVKTIEAQFNAESLRRNSITEKPSIIRNRISMTDLFWKKETPVSCHYRLSEAELIWIEHSNSTYSTKTC